MIVVTKIKPKIWRDSYSSGNFNCTQRHA